MEILLKCTVSFGGEDKLKSLAQQDSETQKKKLQLRVQEELKKQLKDGKREILDTAARTATEHQKRVKVQIDKIIANEKEARSYLNKIRFQQENDNAQIVLERDFIAENRADAAVWSDLDAYQRAE